MKKNEGCIDCNKYKYRTDEEKQKIVKRLNIIEGQVNGIKQMIVDDRYCDDVLIQLLAVTKSLKSIGNNIMKNHLSTCVVEEIQNGNKEIIDEVMYLFGRIQ